MELAVGAAVTVAGGRRGSDSLGIGRSQSARRQIVLQIRFESQDTRGCPGLLDRIADLLVLYPQLHERRVLRMLGWRADVPIMRVGAEQVFAAGWRRLELQLHVRINVISKAH